MNRAAIAAPLGLLGFLAYLLAVLALADHVLHWHLALQVAFFLVAGTAWAWPAHRLVLWAGRR
jgi:hypothetical protein